MVKRAILTGKVSDLNDFIYEWCKDEGGEIPYIEEGMDILMSVREGQEKNMKRLAHAFELQCTMIETAY